MSLKRLLRTFMFAVAFVGAVASTSSCKKDDGGKGDIRKGILAGVVSNDDNQPVEDVTVSVLGTTLKTATAADGSYSIDDVNIETLLVSYSKEGYGTSTVTLKPNYFKDDKVTVDITLTITDSKIRGVVYDAKRGNVPLAGVTVSFGAGSVETNASGEYLIDNIARGDFTLTFSKSEYKTVTRPVKAEDFVDKEAVLDVKIGGGELLRGKTADDIDFSADTWYYNEYKGGRNGDDYPHFDWSVDYMCTLDFVGTWEEQNEGTTIQIRNGDDDKANPADRNMFDSYVYGRKLITEENKIMTLKVRAHGESTVQSPTYYGVQVIDLSEVTPVSVKIGVDKELFVQGYIDETFDLSAYVGKEIVIAIGTYRNATGDYFKQLVLRRIGFAKSITSDWNWLPGTPVAGLTDWKMTEEMVKSTMTQTKTTFTGLSPISGDRGNYADAYRSWRTVSHIAREWSFMPLKKDPEVFPAEGYVIKTRGGGTAANTVTPESYLYSKFEIGQGRNVLTFKVRNFGSNSTFFKVTAITEDIVVTHLDPISNTASSASAAANGCWKFKNDKGGSATPNDYASFVYDLSQFNGKNVVITIGVYKGEENGDESKISFYSVTLN